MRLIENNIENIQEPSFSFPPVVLNYLRTLVPSDIVRKIRGDTYEITLKEICQALALSSLRKQQINQIHGV